MMHGRGVQARTYLQEALDTNRKCVRASSHGRSGAVRKATSTRRSPRGKRIESQSAAYLPLAAERLLKAYVDQNRSEEGLALLRGYLARYPSLDLLNAVFQTVLEREGRLRQRTRARRNCAAHRPCSASTACWRRRCWKRRPNGGATSNS